MKKAFLILLLLAVSVGLFAQDKTLTIGSTVDMLFVPFQFVSRTMLNPNPGMQLDRLDRDPTADSSVEWTNAQLDKEQLDLHDANDYVKFSGIGMALGRAHDSDQRVSASIALTGSYGTSFGMGMTIRVAQGANFNMAQNPFFWWSPFEALRIRVGVGVDAIAGTPGNANSAWGADWALGLPGFVWSGLGDGDGAVSARFTMGDLGFSISIPGIAPFGNRAPNVSNPASPGGSQIFNFANGANDLMYRLMRTQLAVGYNVAGIVNVRLAYFGPNGANNIAPTSHAGLTFNNAHHVTAPGRITEFSGALVTNDVSASPKFELAFRVTAVSGLTLDVGGRFALGLTPKSILSWHELVYDGGQFVPSYSWLGFNESTEMWKLTPPINIGLGGAYAINPDINVGLRADMSFSGKLEIVETGAAATSKLSKGTVVTMPLNMWTKLYGTYRLAALNNMIIGGEFGFQYFGETLIDVGGTGDTVTYGLNTGTPALRFDPTGESGRGFVGGTRVGGGAYVQIPVVQAGNIRIGAFFRTGTVHNIKEDTVFTMPISWSVSF